MMRKLVARKLQIKSPSLLIPPIFRPPSEARSLLLQVTIGCSNNGCTYCNMYRSKRYRVRALPDILEEINALKIFFDENNFYPSKIFLCDGDALSAPMETLLPVVKKLNELLPSLKRIGIYATAQNILDKSDSELSTLVNQKLNFAYLGLESGSNEVLHLVAKRNNALDMVNAALKIRKNGFKLSVIAMLGLGGKKLSQAHCQNSAQVVSQMAPDFFSFLTTISVPGTPYDTMIKRNLIEPLTIKELLQQMRDIIDNLDYTGTKTIFRANHISNSYPIKGILPRDQKQIVTLIESWINDCPDNTYPDISPENL